jgi:hypothetical protein
MKHRLLHQSSGIVPLVVMLIPSLVCAQRNAQQEGPQRLSHVRVVRLSYVSGTVAIERPGSAAWAKAVVNTPIEEGFALQTAAQSFAEVQFENGSTARIGELSRIAFSQLAMDPEGNKLNRVSFEQGYATFHVIPQHHDLYAVGANGDTLTPGGKSEFRTDFDQGRLRVEVFDGSVEVASASGSVRMGKDAVSEFGPGTTVEAANIQKGIQKDAWDKWAQARDTQAELTSADQSVGLNHPLYGWDDLDEYGDWSYVPGYGYGWSPYEANGWMPFSAGLWNWYPSFGWTWISDEPWGWLPYHYGLWNYDASLGWFWMPGNLDTWMPGMVNWYEGAGWVGWSPYGAMLPGGYNGIVSVPGGTVQNGGAINSGTVTRRPPGQGIPIARPTFVPGALAMRSGVALPKGVELPGTPTHLSSKAVAASAVHPVAPGRSLAPTALSHAVAAPRTVLMGGDAATEKAAFTGHQGFWQRLSGEQQPLHMRMGPTLGGHLPAAGLESRSLQSFQGPREFAGTRGMPRGSSFTMPRAFGSGGFVVPHGGAMAGSRGGAPESTAVGGRGGSGGFSSGIASSPSSAMSSGGHTGGAAGGGRH